MSVGDQALTFGFMQRFSTDSGNTRTSYPRCGRTQGALGPFPISTLLGDEELITLRLLVHLYLGLALGLGLELTAFRLDYSGDILLLGLSPRGALPLHLTSSLPPHCHDPPFFSTQ